MTWYRVELSYAVFAIITDENEMIIDAAPIGKWAVGKPIEEVRRWVIKKRGKIEALND